MCPSLWHRNAKERWLSKYCEVLKLAAMPSCLGGGESETKPDASQAQSPREGSNPSLTAVRRWESEKVRKWVYEQTLAFSPSHLLVLAFFYLLWGVETGSHALLSRGWGVRNKAWCKSGPIAPWRFESFPYSREKVRKWEGECLWVHSLSLLLTFSPSSTGTIRALLRRSSRCFLREYTTK